MINELKDDEIEYFDSHGNKLNPELQKMTEEELKKLLNDFTKVNNKVKEHSNKWGWDI